MGFAAPLGSGDKKGLTAVGTAAGRPFAARVGALARPAAWARRADGLGLGVVVARRAASARAVVRASAAQ